MPVTHLPTQHLTDVPVDSAALQLLPSSSVWGLCVASVALSLACQWHLLPSTLADSTAAAWKVGLAGHQCTCNIVTVLLNLYCSVYSATGVALSLY